MSSDALITVFLGPSLPLAEAERIFPAAELRPPARRGDLDALDESACRSVVLIDGAMVYEHPPSPSEVYRLIKRGVHVTGAASLGALRAVELADLGMRGCGWVFEEYRVGRVTADDEVVARVDPRTGRAATIFLINVRYAAARLVEKGVVGENQMTRLLARLSALYFEDRSPVEVKRLAQQCGVTPQDAEALLDPQFDVKARDAAACLAAEAAR